MPFATNRAFTALFLSALLSSTSNLFAIDVTWSDDFALTGPDGNVNTVISVGDSWIMGGTFYSVAGEYVSNLAVLENGQWSPLDPNFGISGPVYALAELPDGRIAVGGYFGQAGDEPADCLAIWDGTSWEGITGISQWDRVYALTVDHEGALWVGGNFETFNEEPTTGIMRLVDGVQDHSVGTPFDNTGILDPTIWDIAIDSQGRVLASGWYDRVNSQTSSGVARWDGTSWSRLGATQSDGGSTYSVATQGEDIWVCGNFDSWNGQPASGLMQYTGGQWVFPDNPPIEGLTSLLIDGDDIWTANSWGSDFLHYNGQSWENIDIMSGGSQSIRGWATNGSGTVCLVGGFASINGVPALHTAFHSDETGWAAAHDAGAAKGLHGAVYYDNASGHAIHDLGEEGLLIHGNFFGSEGQLFPSFAIWTGSEWVESPFPLESSNLIMDIAPQDIFVYDSQGFRRWDRTLQSWHTLGENSEQPNGGITLLSASEDGNQVFAGGYFMLQNEGETTAMNLAVWNRSSDQWSPVGASGPEAGVDGILQSIEVDDMGGVLIAGGFTIVDGIAAGAVARWDGTTWDTFGGELSGDVSNMITAGEDIWVAGSLDLYGQTSGAAHYSPSTGWALLDVEENKVKSLLELPGGEIMLGGSFTQLEGQVATGLSMWSNGEWHDLGASPQGVGFNGGTIQAMAYREGHLYLGGRFYNLGNQAAHAFCSVTFVATPLAVTDLHIQARGSSLNLDWSPVTGAELYRIYHFEGAWDEQAAGTLIGTVAQPPFDLSIEDPVGFFRVTSASSPTLRIHHR